MIIIGEIGSGKSSLLNAMLGQMLYLPHDVLQNSTLFSGSENNKPDQDQGDEVEQAAKLGELSKSLFDLPVPKSPEDYPLLLRGSTSFVEQQPWI